MSSLLRLRVGGLVLTLESPGERPILRVPPTHRPFLTSRGADIRLTVVDAPVPLLPRRKLLFESGGPWRVFDFEGGRLYQLRSAACAPTAYRGIAIDSPLRCGTLYAPSGPAVPRFTLEHPIDELLFTHRLAREGHATLHACGIALGRSVALLCGPSGAGKSTSARLWSRLQPKARVLSDDRIVVRRSPTGLRAFGTPWHGETRFALPASGRPTALFLLRHAPETRLHRLSAAEAAGRLFACTFPPLWDSRDVSAILDCCQEIASRLPCFDLAFRPDHTAVETVLEALSRPRMA